MNRNEAIAAILNAINFSPATPIGKMIEVTEAISAIVNDASYSWSSVQGRESLFQGGRAVVQWYNTDHEWRAVT